MKISKSLLKLLASGVVVSAVLTGCNQAGLNAPTSSGDIYVDPEFQGAPDWVMNTPFINGKLTAVGSAPRNAGNDMQFQKELAIGSGRDNLARQISISVKNMLKRFASSTGTGKDGTYDNSSETVSKQIASETITNSRAIKSWISKTGTYYVLVVKDTSSVVDTMDKKVKTSYKNDKAMYQRFLHAKAQGELEQELEKMNQ
jgi:hypothetical protein